MVPDVYSNFFVVFWLEILCDFSLALQTVGLFRIGVSKKRLKEVDFPSICREEKEIVVLLDVVERAGQSQSKSDLWFDDQRSRHRWSDQRILTWITGTFTHTRSLYGISQRSIKSEIVSRFFSFWPPIPFRTQSERPVAGIILPHRSASIVESRHSVYIIEISPSRFAQRSRSLRDGRENSRCRQQDGCGKFSHCLRADDSDG